MPYDAAPLPMAVIYQERCLELADFLEKLPPEQFDMTSFFGTKLGATRNLADWHECGTTACGAGWAIIHFKLPYGSNHCPDEFAGNYLGLSAYVRNAMFFHMSCQTPKEFAVMLRHYVATGEVVWG